MALTGYVHRFRKFQPNRRKGLVYITIMAFLVMLFFYWRWLPAPLFNNPTSTVLVDRDGQLLGAKISTDQQWRFPESDRVPEKFEQAILHYEDRYFRYHPGFNLVAMARAAYLNFRYHRVVSGGSTITMQVIRMARKNRKRSYFEKICETLLAIRLELGNSKTKILRFYASHAPFGGNVVGLEAAAWRYFGVRAEQLSWAETATLAVLPNSPGLIYPGRNPDRLLAKRNRLLDLLHSSHVIDSATCALAKSERLPEKQFALPQLAPHLLDRMIKEGRKGKKTATTLDITLQERINNILEIHAAQLKANEIHNAAVLVLEVNTGKVLAYVGNISKNNIAEYGNNVDIITSPRSTGSILKPFLYAAMLNDGLLLPNTLVPDIPMQVGGFIPENYNLTYDGAVPAKRALSRSLNIPAVKMLQTYGYSQFYALLRNIGMTTLVKPAGHYGLALILGGAEATLWDLAGIYGSMARTLNHFSGNGTGYKRTDFHPPVLTENEKQQTLFHGSQSSWFDAGSIWLTFEAMVEVARPDEDIQWQSFSSSRKIAWKTGTSFGNRDGWSIGVTPGFVVAVWVGNASGEGRPGLTGIGVAAPILFDVFKALPATDWFRQPIEAMVQSAVCRYSGYRASSICESTDTMWIPKTGIKTAACPFHQMVHLDETGRWQVHSGCETPGQMQHVSWFVLPPVQEWYFRGKNPFYKPLPPFRPDCGATDERKNMEIIYPKNNSRIYIPVELDGRAGNAVVKLAHRNPQALVYWHLDDRFLGRSTKIHQMAISPHQGMHRLTLVDENGETLVIRFWVLTKDE